MNSKIDWQDVLVRALILLAGAVAAVLLHLKGDTVALPALALGSVLGFMLINQLQSPGEG